jgi:hypothetical protein
MEENHNEFEEFENLRTNVNLSMFLYEKDIKSLDEEGEEDLREIDLKKKLEFGICDSDGKTVISFEFGTLKVDKKVFDKTLERYLGRNKFIKEQKENSLF